MLTVLELDDTGGVLALALSSILLLLEEMGFT